MVVDTAGGEKREKKKEKENEKEQWKKLALKSCLLPSESLIKSQVCQSRSNKHVSKSMYWKEKLTNSSTTIQAGGVKNRTKNTGE